jgi:hypothetical protein
MLKLHPHLVPSKSAPRRAHALRLSLALPVVTFVLCGELSLGGLTGGESRGIDAFAQPTPPTTATKTPTTTKELSGAPSSKTPSGGDEEDLDAPALDPTPKSAASSETPSSSSNTEGTNKEGLTSKVKVDKLAPELKEQPQRGDELYQRQIAQIEAQVNELKEEIFRSRTRLSILKETVLAIGLSGAEAQIIHRNEMGANFKLERILYVVDGDPIRQITDKDGSLDSQKEIEIFNGPITPENHTLQVELIYRGNGFGVFSYLQSYRFTLNDVYTFRPEEGKRLVIKTIGYERGGVMVDLMERPAIRFDKSEVDIEKEERSGAQ